jgi:S1-C subfamily serine protease
MIVAVRAHAPGDTVTLTVSDGSSTKDVRITLGSDAPTG